MTHMRQNDLLGVQNSRTFAAQLPPVNLSFGNAMRRFGVRSWVPGKSMLPGTTLQFMPKREDQYGQDEYADPKSNTPPCAHHAQAEVTLWR